MKTNIRKHWEKVYQTKSPEQVSWTQTVPKTSLEFILSLGLSPKAKNIDVGGSDSNLVDFLLDKGFENNDFNKIRCIKKDNITPSKSIQNFLFCSFRKN